MNYLTSADDLAQMVADGTFPPPRHPGETTSAPRVGDGLIRLDASGKVTYASPTPSRPSAGWASPPTWSARTWPR